ncbi:ATP-binding cassette sub-family C member 4-like isoform X2 [Phymastichus coffea]|nr:ATP-binding cassette sub-family C member 4-like isoform X2 [Phymastichus coffea]
MPIVLAVITFLIYRQLGVAAFAGILFMSAQIIPTQVCWYRMTSTLRAKSAARTDKRVLLIGEIVGGIRSIKMYAWERSFERLVRLARRREIDAIVKQFYVKSVSLAFAVFTHRAALFCTIFVYVQLDHAMTADKIFSTVNYFMLVRMVMARFFPEAVFLGAEVNVSIKRIEEFLLRDEIDARQALPTKLIGDSAVSVKEVNASWGGGSTSSVKHVGNVNLRIAPRKLYAVVGPVGSGKSSLLKLILGELQPTTGRVVVSGEVSYASQEPWLFAGSVKDNILFGEAYDEERYDRVATVCALLEDLDQLPFGDKTLVGERGMSLSGGQCARVHLARAVYRDTDIYLLDDPLSAVDTRVSKNLFDNCINGLLKNKTRILVTHQMQYLRQADGIIVLNNGAIEFQGTYQTLVSNKQYLEHLPLNDQVEKSSVEDKNGRDAVNLIPVVKRKEITDKEPKETEELLAKGRISKYLYLKYFKAGGSYFTFAVMMLLFVLTQVSISGFDYWLSFWTNQEERRLKGLNSLNNTDDNRSATKVDEYLDNETALYVCGGLVIAIVIFSNIRNLLFYRRALKSSRNIHNRMFSQLVRTPMQFFNLNPSGRIVNRFSKDTGEVDTALPNSMMEVIERILFTLGVITQILIINWWTIGPIVIVGLLFVKINDFYLSTAQVIKRLESNAKSPVFSLVTSTLLGLPTIRSCQAQTIVRRDFDKRQDAHTAAHYLYLVTSAAYGFWLDFLSIALLVFLAYSFILLNDRDTFAGDVGLALTQVLTICGMLQFVMKQIAELMGQMTSVERMFQFTELEREGLSDGQPVTGLDKDWPCLGEIKFEKVYLRYSEDEQPILKNLNFTITPNMKVGIVGRTGAGKSSLVLALFRLANYDGSLLIDNVDTRRIDLLELRTKISIIPQEPTLFTASLRDNLDPLHQHDDVSLWSALEEVEMNKAFESLEEPVDGNLSAGQRQLLCLARAILKRNKILVLDEATANVDPATDELIQRTIRAKFGDCTVLTIAHRLTTIMDSDRILVMDAGEVVEFDRPEILLAKNNGYFANMVRETGSA